MIGNKSYIDELVDYIKSNLKKGYTKESLKWALIKQGNSKTEVSRAFKKVDVDLAHKAPILKTRPKIKYEVIEPKGYTPKLSLFQKFKNFLRVWV